jgi:hypothetical protein
MKHLHELGRHPAEGTSAAPSVGTDRGVTGRGPPAMSGVAQPSERDLLAYPGLRTVDGPCITSWPLASKASCCQFVDDGLTRGHDIVHVPPGGGRFGVDGAQTASQLSRVGLGQWAQLVGLDQQSGPQPVRGLLLYAVCP